MLASECAGQVAGDEAVDNLDLVDVACFLEQVKHRKLQDRVLQPLGLHLIDRYLGDQGGVL